MERGDVLQRHEDVPVQLDVGDVLDVAVGGEDTLLVLASEEGDLDLLALVFVGVVLDAQERSRSKLVKRVVNALFAIKRAVCSGACRLAAPTIGGDRDVGACSQIRRRNCSGKRASTSARVSPCQEPTSTSRSASTVMGVSSCRAATVSAVSSARRSALE